MNFDKEIDKILKNAGVKLNEDLTNDWKDAFEDEATLIPYSEEYQRGADEYWRTYLQHKKEVEGLTPDEEDELAELEAKYKRSLN